MNASDWVPDDRSGLSEDVLVSDNAKHYFRAIVQYGVQVFVQCVGIITNTINIVVFAKTGLKDSVTLTFLGLAISDLLHLMSYLIYRLVLMSDFYFRLGPHIDPIGFGYPFSLYAIYFYDVSMYITVFAAIQKCCCVVFPLRFKNAFTPRRTFLIITAIFIVTLGVFLPVLSGLPFVTATNPRTNQSILTVSILPHYRPSEYYWQSVVKTGLTPMSQLVVIVCLVIMARELRVSARFRMNSKAATSSEQTSNDQNPKMALLSKKELRALRAVQLVCLVFVVTSLPPAVAYIVQSAYPPYNTPRLLNLKHVVGNLVYFFGTINASVNILFYLKYNTNYRNAFWGLCKVCRREKGTKPEVPK